MEMELDVITPLFYVSIRPKTNRDKAFGRFLCVRSGQVLDAYKNANHPITIGFRTLGRIERGDKA